jgi:hypothetical protein
MIRVVDNVLSDKVSQYIFEQCASLKWTFVPDISFGSEAQRSVPGFSHSFFLHEDFNNTEKKTIQAPEYSFIAPVLLSCFDALGIDIPLSAVFRSRARLTLPRPELDETARIDNKHIDYRIPHLVLIYYVNTTDGDTLLYEGNRVVEKITPRRSRCVLFDGSIVHSSSTSTLSPRIIINNNIRIGVPNGNNAS